MAEDAGVRGPLFFLKVGVKAWIAGLLAGIILFIPFKLVSRMPLEPMALLALAGVILTVNLFVYGLILYKLYGWK